MNIELKGLKHLASMSEETPCFTATVWIDGKKAGSVKNSGHGGCNFYTPHDLQATLETYAQTLPPLTISGTTIEQSADIVIGEAFDAYLRRRDLIKLLRGQIVTIKDGKLYGQRLKGITDVMPILQHREKDIRKVLGIADDAPIVNLMSFDEAMEVYRQTTSDQ